MHGINPSGLVRLVDVQTSLSKTLPEMAAIVSDCLHDEPYSKDELSKLLEITVQELENNILSENTRHVDQFKLKQRASHVFQGNYWQTAMIRISWDSC